ncbi:MAG: aminotransferase class I/II-fold pyridoxal phosphate-dependent enzyme [Candidatus Woesearchaeota archaeon]|jgi:glycine C-acetyltransferase
MKKAFAELLKKEIARIDATQTDKRHEKVIEGFTTEKRAIVKGKEYMIFNSNDYLGLRHHPTIQRAEEDASKKYGSGPGAVRFISGTMKVHKELEHALAQFHNREDAMVFSSAFAANMALLHCLIKGQSKDSLVSNDVLVISDELNHRSIIDGIRVAGLSSENKAIFKHMDITDLDRVLNENKGKFKRVIVVTDGIFSMLGEYQDIRKMQEVITKYQDYFEEGIISVVDDSHGVGAFGKTGRGCEEMSQGRCDVLLATMGKGFGTDGGYITADKIVIDYLRESAATYIYSNPIPPGTAGAALKSVQIVNSPEGKELLKKLNYNITHFKRKMLEAGFKFAVDSIHAIQPLLIADTEKTKKLTMGLFELGVIVTNINYPVVPRGRDEIRVQISAAHTEKDINEFVEKCIKVGKSVGVI